MIFVRIARRNTVTYFKHKPCGKHEIYTIRASRVRLTLILCVSRGRREKFLSLIQVFNTFTFYGIDISLLALLTVFLTQFLKKTLFKSAQKKIITFLPFMLGTIFYAVYAGLRNLSLLYVLNEYSSILEHGISVGAIATLYYIMYEQFVREKKATSQTEQVISALIEGYIPAESVERASKAIAEALARDVTGNGMTRAQEILAEYSDGEIDERNMQLLCRLIIETLAHLTTK